MKSNKKRCTALTILLTGSIISVFLVTSASAVSGGLSVAPAAINITNARATMNTAFEEGNWPRVTAYAELITTTDPASGADIWCTWSYALRKMGDYEGALDAANEALARDPDNHQCYLNRGYIHLALGNWTDARMDAESALRYAPTDAAAYNIIAMGLLGQKDERNALVAAESALGLDPENAEYLNTKGMILISTGDYGNAVAVLTKAVEVSGEEYDAPYPDASTPKENLNEAQRLYDENSVSPYLIFAAAGLILVVAAGAGLIRRRIK